MESQPDPTATEFYRDRADWGDAILCGLFLLVFPPTIIAMWLEPRDSIPLYAVLPFTIVFLLGAPFLFKTLMSARSRRIWMDDEGSLRVRETTPFSQNEWTVNIDGIEKLVFKTVDNDGFWYRAMIFLKDGRQVTFAQGGHEPGVRELYESLLEKLRRFDASLASEELRTRH